jgi:hypothetical protein
MSKWNNTPEGTATAFSSDGEFDFDIRTGKVTRLVLKKSFGSLPIRVDVPEHTKWYRGILTDGFACDVLGLSYWTRKEYMPACMDWRKDCMDRRLDDSEFDFGPVSAKEKAQKKEGLRAERAWMKKVRAEK